VQADKFGARTPVPQEAVGLRSEDGHYHIELSDGGEVAARSVIAASGPATAGWRCPAWGVSRA
jgi:thioredoxin reductase (NADPH)